MLEMTQKEYDELYPAWQYSRLSPINNSETFKEFVQITRQQRAFDKASQIPFGIKIVG